MGKLATDILAIKEMINSFKNTNLQVEDIFNIINKNEAFILDKNNDIELNNFLNHFDMLEKNLKLKKSKKNKKGKDLN